jgi:hypothetical protein
VTRVGLADLLSLTGDAARPDAQRFWLNDDCGVGAQWGRPCEGSVRARLGNFLAAPLDQTGLAPAFERFAPAFQEALASESSSLDDHVGTLDTLLQHPVAVAEAVAGDVERPAELLADLNGLLYHPGTVETRGLEDSLRSLGSWLSGGTVPEGVPLSSDAVSGLASYLASDADELAGVPDRSPGDGGTFDYEGRLERFHGRPADPTGDAGPDPGDDPLPGSTAHTLVERVLPACLGDDLGRSFRNGVLESLRRGLLQASYTGVYGSVPNSAAGGTAEAETTLVAQAEVVRDELAERTARSQALDAGEDADTVEAQVGRLEALLGDEFVVLPRFAPANPAELNQTFGASETLLEEEPYGVDTWLQRAARIRDRPAEFREQLTYADVFDLAVDDGGDVELRRSLTVGQLPHGLEGGAADADWVGLDGVTPDGGELSMASLFVTEPEDAAAPVSKTPGDPAMAGLLVDEWVQKVPEADQTLGVGFRYDDPDARAPQSVVLAVPPAWRAGSDGSPEASAPVSWSSESLLSTLEETASLFRARSVDLDGLADPEGTGIGHVLPATCLAYNVGTEPPDADEVSLPDAPTVLLDAFRWSEGGPDV